MDKHEEFRTSKKVKVTLKFTPEELLARVHELDEARRSRDVLEDLKKKSAKDFRTADTHCEVLASEVCKGEGDVEVEADEVVIFATNTVETRRRDTGEVLASRPMTKEERQPNLFIVKDGEAVNRETGEIATVTDIGSKRKRKKKDEGDNEQADLLTAPADEGSLLDAELTDPAGEEITDPEAVLADDAGVDAPVKPKKGRKK